MSDLPTMNEATGAMRFIGRLEQYHGRAAEKSADAFAKVKHNKSKAACKAARKIIEAYAKGRIK